MTPTLSAVKVISPFPDIFLPLVWEWMNEYPERNFDDYGPKSLDEWVASVADRYSRGEYTWCVFKDDQPVGFIGFQPLTPRYGTFHGICFTQSAWGRDTTMVAVQQVIDQLWAAGGEKLSAGFFADNPKIYRFFRDLGAVEEGYLRAQTVRNGVPVDVRLMALFKEDLCQQAV